MRHSEEWDLQVNISDELLSSLARCIKDHAWRCWWMRVPNKYLLVHRIWGWSIKFGKCIWPLFLLGRVSSLARVKYTPMCLQDHWCEEGRITSLHYHEYPWCYRRIQEQLDKMKNCIAIFKDDISPLFSSLHFFPSLFFFC